MKLKKHFQIHVNEAYENKIDELEIICGKGSGQLKKKVLAFSWNKKILAKSITDIKKILKTGEGFLSILNRAVTTINIR